VPVDEAVKEIGQVVEGLNALPAALELAEKYEVEMPIVQALDMIVNKGVDPVDMVEMLMSREKKSEIANDVMERFFESRKAARKRS
jgi:glycerol-3-phosphate dehydrogenase (NAD(P)+)